MLVLDVETHGTQEKMVLARNLKSCHDALGIDVGRMILIEGRHYCVLQIQILEKFPSVPNTWFLVGKACTVLLHGS
jgi:hypothetical protein